MTESKHKHARSKDERPTEVTRDRSERARRKAEAAVPWTRTTRGWLALGGVVLGGVLVFRLLTDGSADGGDPADELAGASGSTLAGVTSWIAKDGSAYRMTVTPSSQLVNAASSSGCIPVPSAGTTNLQFTVEIENKSPTAAAVPSLEFAANIKDSGVVDAKLTSFARASTRIELLPLATTRSCAEASQIGPVGRDAIEPGTSTTFTGTLAGVRTPIGDGLALIVRYVKADARAASGASKSLVTVPFNR